MPKHTVKQVISEDSPPNLGNESSPSQFGGYAFSGSGFVPTIDFGVQIKTGWHVSKIFLRIQTKTIFSDEFVKFVDQLQSP